MTRANRVTIQAMDNGYKATFYRTHKVLVEIQSTDTEWTAQEDSTNKTQQREDFRQWVISHADQWDIQWDNGKAEQAWDRKYQTYQTADQIEEDAITLLTPMMERLVDKCKYQISLDSISLLSVDAVDTNLSYIEDGKYASNNNWAWADITMQISIVEGLEIEYHMSLKSGQICKPKLTIAEFEEIIKTESELGNVELVDLKAQAKAEKESKKKGSNAA